MFRVTQARDGPIRVDVHHILSTTDECVIIGTFEHEWREGDAATVAEEEAPEAIIPVGSHRHHLLLVIDLFHNKISIHGWNVNEGGVVLVRNIKPWVSAMWRLLLFYSEGEFDFRAMFCQLKRLAGIPTTETGIPITETNPKRGEEKLREEVKDVDAAHSSSLGGLIDWLTTVE